MGLSIMSLNNYSKLFSSPVGNIANPSANLIYGGTISSMYTKKLSDLFKSDMSSYLSSLNSKVYDLKTSSQSLVESNKNSIFNATKAASTDAAVSASASTGATTGTYTLSVNQLAQSQNNRGTELYSNTRNSMSTGENTFKITVNNKESQLSFNVNYNDSNNESLNNMAKSINKAGLGVTAKVITNDTKKTSYMEITSNDTGAKNSFSISDTYGNAVEKSGVSVVSQIAKDAVYKLDGEEHTSASNILSLDSGNLNVTFNAVSQKEATVTVKDDKDAIINVIESFASQFNQALSFVKSPNQFVISDKLGKELKSVVSSKQGTLSSIGINVKYDGSLEVDEKKLGKALDEDPQRVKKLVGGFDGIASKVSKLAARTLTSTALDTTGQTLYNSDFNSFYSYLKNANKNLFQRNQSMGLFVDTLL